MYRKGKYIRKKSQVKNKRKFETGNGKLGILKILIRVH